jgi:GAF domain-containing protein
MSADGPGGAEQALLQSVVDVARAIFGARASSIMLVDEDAQELVFEAVSGEGSGHLAGRRIAVGTGIAGWVLAARQPIVIDDVAADPRFASDVASSTGYVPKGLMVTPLLREDRALGVLSVLDRPRRSAFDLVELDLLGAFGTQAYVALDVIRRARRADEGGPPVLRRLADRLDGLPPARRRVAELLLEDLEALL